MAVTTPGTPQLAAQYLVRLDNELHTRSGAIELLEDYYEGRHNLVFATSRFRQAFGNLFHEFADNWMALIVDASVERLNIQGFRLKGAKNKLALDAWDESDLDAQSVIAHTEAVKLGKSYLMLDDRELTDSGFARITVEHPAQVIVATDPGNRHRRLAALKEWVDDSGYVYATVYLQDRIFRYQTDKTVDEMQKEGGYGSGRGDTRQWPTEDFTKVPSSRLGPNVHWIPREDGFPFESPHSFEVVPILCLDNNPTLKVGGRSDILNVIPIQNAINKLAMDMVIASEFAAFAQRWATGIEIPHDEETGRSQSEEKFLASVARVWTAEEPDAKFGQFEASDLKNYVHAIEMFIQHLAALTRTPPHYLLGQSGNFPSGDSLTATETGLVAKVQRKQKDFGGPWGEGMVLSIGTAGTKPKRAKPIWADAEQRIRATRVDAAMKLSTVGVPQPSIWAEAGFSPADIRRMRKERLDIDLPEWGTEFAPLTPEQQAAEAPASPGPTGTSQQNTLTAQTERVERVND